MQEESVYVDIFISPVRKCRHYLPKFGKGTAEEAVSLPIFLNLYGSDPLYARLGLDSLLVYAAHKAAGGITSIYRQIGIGCERLFQHLIYDIAEYERPAQVVWSYETKTANGQTKTLSLDGRLGLSDVKNLSSKNAAVEWMASYCKEIDVSPPVNGVVFEVRQGYKSKDSKRQNADIDNATVAWANGYLPAFAVFFLANRQRPCSSVPQPKVWGFGWGNDRRPQPLYFRVFQTGVGLRLGGVFPTELRSVQSRSPKCPSNIAQSQ